MKENIDINKIKEYKRNAINKFFFSRKFKTSKIHFGPLVLAASKCYCEDNGHKTDLFQNICFKERSNMAIASNLWVTLNLYKK